MSAAGPNAPNFLRVPVKNPLAEDVPPYGAVKLLAADADGVCPVAKPSLDSDPDVFFVGENGLAKDGGAGWATMDSPAVAACDPADGAPANGEDWGTAANSFLLRQGKTGFRAVGPAGTGAGMVLRRGGGGGGVVVRADGSGASVSAFVQGDDGAGGLEDVGTAITVKKFTAPAREDFEEDGYYMAVQVGEQWYAETGPKTVCGTVVTATTCVDGVLSVTTATKRFIDRACP
jgi:hypothetical protein